MPKLPKPLQPQIITLPDAKMMNCHTLYEGFRERVHVDDVLLVITPVTTNGEVLQTLKYVVPDSLQALSDFCRPGFSSFEISGDYKSTDASPDELMTRAEFVFETLGIWERMLGQLSPLQRQNIGTELDTAASVLRRTYMVEELGDISYLEEEQNCPAMNTAAPTDTQQKLFGA